MDTCFREGDEGHVTAHDLALRAAKNCGELYSYKKSTWTEIKDDKGKKIGEENLCSDKR